VQNNLLALVQQNAEGGAEQEYRNVGFLGAGFGFKRDLAALSQQKPRDIRDAHQEPFALDLPGRPRCAGLI
jgi:hypothetical protein